jgi:hypothetical protein
VNRLSAGAAAELRLPITVPNQAHAQFINRESNDPLQETETLTHRHVTTTQIYDKRRIAVSESASHDVPI